MSKPFKMRSGNSPMFKNIGSSSPAKQGMMGAIDPDPQMAQAVVNPQQTMMQPMMKKGSPAKRKHNLKPADIDKGGREAAFKPDTNVMRKTGSPAKHARADTPVTAGVLHRRKYGKGHTEHNVKLTKEQRKKVRKGVITGSELSPNHPITKKGSPAKQDDKASSTSTKTKKRLFGGTKTVITTTDDTGKKTKIKQVHSKKGRLKKAKLISPDERIKRKFKEKGSLREHLEGTTQRTLTKQKEKRDTGKHKIKKGKEGYFIRSKKKGEIKHGKKQEYTG